MAFLDRFRGRGGLPAVREEPSLMRAGPAEETVIDVGGKGEIKRTFPPAPDDDYWYAGIGGAGPTAAGAWVSPESAMRLSAMNACVRVLAETVAQTPLPIYRRLPNGGKERATNHPLYDLLTGEPNSWQTAYEFKEMLQGHVSLRGTAYAEILPGPRGFADQLEPLHPARVRPEWMSNGGIRWIVTDPDTGRQRILLQGEIFVLRGLSSDGLEGLSPVGMAREAIGLGLAAQSHGATLFSQGTMSAGVLETDKVLADAVYERLRRDWQRHYAGPRNWHKPPILEHGLKWHEIGMTNEDAQFLETRKFQVVDIARMYRIPLHMIGDLDKATFSNIEHLSIEFLTHTMGPWFRRWEGAIRRDLILDPTTYFAEFLVEGLLRGDIQTRYSAYGTGRQQGWLSVNEIRERENMNPIEGGDQYMVPLNMVPASQQGRQGPQQRDNPGGAASRAWAGAMVAVAERLLEKEVRTLNDLMDGTGDESRLRDEAAAFYARHARLMAAGLGIASAKAERYCGEQLAALERVLADDPRGGVIELLEDWKIVRIQDLIALIQEERE